MVALCPQGYVELICYPLGSCEAPLKKLILLFTPELCRNIWTSTQLVQHRGRAGGVGGYP